MRNADGINIVQGELSQKDVNRLLEILKSKTAEIKKLNNDPWILNEKIEKVRGFMALGKTDEALNSIRLADEIKLE